MVALASALVFGSLALAPAAPPAAAGGGWSEPAQVAPARFFAHYRPQLRWFARDMPSVWWEVLSGKDWSAVRRDGLWRSRRLPRGGEQSALLPDGRVLVARLGRAGVEVASGPREGPLRTQRLLRGNAFVVSLRSNAAGDAALLMGRPPRGRSRATRTLRLWLTTSRRGHAFSDPVPLDTTGRARGGRVAVDASGRVRAAWVRDRRAYLVSSRAGARRPARIRRAGPTNAVLELSLAAHPSGTYCFGWRGMTPAGRLELEGLLVRPGRPIRHWKVPVEPPASVTGDREYLDIDLAVVPSSNACTVAWEAAEAGPGAGRQIFSLVVGPSANTTPLAISSSGVLADLGGGDIAPDETVGLVWEEVVAPADNAAGTQETRVVRAGFLRGGALVTEPETVSGAFGPDPTLNSPAIAFDPFTGRPATVWVTSQSLGGPHGVIYAERSPLPAAR
jgi:hypothetical protein